VDQLMETTEPQPSVTVAHPTNRVSGVASGIRRPDLREVSAVALTLGANAIVHRVLPHATHVPTNLVTAGAVIGIAKSAGASRADLGLDPADLAAGARVGCATAGALVAVVAAGGALPPTRGYFGDTRVTAVDDRRALYELLVRIPLGTALAEELLFRSGLTALFAQRRSWPAAVAASSVVFGLWHVLPTYDSLVSHPGADRVRTRAAHRAGAVASVVATTAIAGAAFAWLQRRTNSVLAPVLVHAALNASTYATGRVLARRH
jgi:CAAX protease family protein